MDLIARQYGLRRVADKVNRRFRRLAGRPDNSPWILDPRPSARDTHVDFIFGLNYLSPNSQLVRQVAQRMGSYGLSVLLANNTNVDRIARDIERGWIHPHVYLDLSSYPGDPFWNLLEVAAKRGVYTIRNLAHTKWILKAQGHPILQQHGIPVPPTVIFKKDDPDRDLTPEELRLLGQRVVIKPSSGGAGKGVVLGVEPTKQNIAHARDFDRSDDWLVQKMISWINFEDRPAYLRGFGVCGDRTLLWWSHKVDGHGGYSPLSWSDLQRYDLYPAVQLVEKLQAITAMDYFSVEIAICRGLAADRFCLIDYVNDQCDLDAHAHPEYSVPQTFTTWAVDRLADFVYRRKHGIEPSPMRGLFLHPG